MPFEAIFGKSDVEGVCIGKERCVGRLDDRCCGKIEGAFRVRGILEYYRGDIIVNFGISAMQRWMCLLVL